MRDEISEIRIEGHTSSEWEGQTAGDEKYINNAELSQKRSYQVLNYVYLLPAIEPHRKWLRPLFSAAGLSYSQPVLDKSGKVDEERSRRVEFHAKTRAEEKNPRYLATKRPWQDNDHGGKNYTPIVAKEMVVYGRTLNGRLRNGKSG